MTYEQMELTFAPPDTRSAGGPDVVDRTGGDLFASGAHALVNAVNCVGVMGKGIALEFRNRYPGAYIAYRRAHQRGELRPGRCQLALVEAVDDNPLWVVNLPTKRHWRDPSRLDDVDAGLRDLATQLPRAHMGVPGLKIRSIAVPALGCGLGGLRWDDVRPLIVKHLGPTGVRILLYGPRP